MQKKLHPFHRVGIPTEGKLFSPPWGSYEVGIRRGTDHKKRSQHEGQVYG